MWQAFKKLFHFHKWSGCPENQIDDMGCFIYEATCLGCGEKSILGGVLSENDLTQLKYKRKYNV